jgi:hypothetical protein
MQTTFTMPNDSNLDFFKPQMHTINNAIIAMKQFTPNGAAKFRNNSPQRGQAATKQVLKNKLSPTDKKTTNG